MPGKVGIGQITVSGLVIGMLFNGLAESVTGVFLFTLFQPGVPEGVVDIESRGTARCSGFQQGYTGVNIFDGIAGNDAMRGLHGGMIFSPQAAFKCGKILADTAQGLPFKKSEDDKQDTKKRYKNIEYGQIVGCLHGILRPH